MATISSLGIGSGLDLNGMISKLMQVEALPLRQMDTKEASYQAKISALGSIKGSLSSLQSAMSAFTLSAGQTALNKFATYSASVADSTVASASAGAGAVAGSYSLQVTAVAKANQIKSANLTSPSTVIGTGTITIERGSVSGGAFTNKTGTGKVNITIDTSNNTLAGIADAINKSGAGVSASIVSGTGSAYLMVTSDNTGTQDKIKITTTAGLSALSYNPTAGTNPMTEVQAAVDASYSINNLPPVTSTSNTITDAISGITLTLKPNMTLPANTTVTVSKDTSSSLVAAFNGLAKAFNDFSKMAHSMSAYDATTKKGGPLLGNATLRSAQSQVAQALGSIPSGATGTYTRLAQIGVTLQKDGTMSVDTAKLQAAISKDYSSVANLASSLGTALNKTLTGLVGTSGIFTSATDGLDRTIKSIGKQREAFNQRLSDIQARYQKQFSALDTSVSQMNSTSNYLSQQLSSLSKMG